MNANEVREQVFKQQSLIDERAVLSQIAEADSTVGNIKELLEENYDLDGAEEALEAYNQDKIGQAYFDFIGNCKDRIGQITAELNAMPRISLKDFMNAKNN